MSAQLTPQEIAAEQELNANGQLSDRQIRLLEQDPALDMLPFTERWRQAAVKYGLPPAP